MIVCLDHVFYTITFAAIFDDHGSLPSHLYRALLLGNLKNKYMKTPNKRISCIYQRSEHNDKDPERNRGPGFVLKTYICCLAWLLHFVVSPPSPIMFLDTYVLFVGP